MVEGPDAMISKHVGGRKAVLQAQLLDAATAPLVPAPHARAAGLALTSDCWVELFVEQRIQRNQITVNHG